MAGQRAPFGCAASYRYPRRSLIQPKSPAALIRTDMGLPRDVTGCSNGADFNTCRNSSTSDSCSLRASKPEWMTKPFWRIGGKFARSIALSFAIPNVSQAILRIWLCAGACTGKCGSLYTLRTRRIRPDRRSCHTGCRMPLRVQRNVISPVKKGIEHG